MTICKDCACYFVCQYQIPEIVGDCFVPKAQANVIPLPCRLGTTVYVISGEGQVEECVVIGAYDSSLNGNLLMLVRRKGFNHGYGTFPFDYGISPSDLGITWFYDEDEAVRFSQEVWWD